jgi:HEAT repeat protein
MGIFDRFFGPPDVDKLQAKGDVNGLIRALGYNRDRPGSSYVHREAARALGEIGDPRAAAPLATMLPDCLDGDVRDAVEQALVKLGAPSVQPLCQLLTTSRDDTGFTHRAAVRALGEIGEKGAVDALCAALKSRHAEVRQTAAAALGKIKEKSAVKHLSAALKDSKRDVRLAVIRALGNIGGTGAIKPLVSALQDEEVSYAVIDPLEQLGWQPGKDKDGACYWIVKGKWDDCAAIGAPAVDVLIRQLTHKSARFSSDSRPAGDALAKIGTPALQPLITALNGDDDMLGVDAARVLGMIGDARAVPSLLAALAHRKDDVRIAAAQALGVIGDPSAVDSLIKLLNDRSEKLYWATAEALVRLYQSGKLDAAAAARILACRSTIISKSDHSDVNNNCGHMDQDHFSRGADFPL